MITRDQALDLLHAAHYLDEHAEAIRRCYGGRLEYMSLWRRHHLSYHYSAISKIEDIAQRWPFFVVVHDPEGCADHLVDCVQVHLLQERE